MTPDELRVQILNSLINQGFSIDGSQILPPKELGKENLRLLHSAAVQHKVDAAKDTLSKYEGRLLDRIAAGDSISPERIRPRLQVVAPGSLDELLFRYVGLHWSVPVSSGYGRRLRFLVVDDQNDKLIGIVGLGDPVFSLSDRDVWVGWSTSTRREQLRYVMEAFVLGAVPPYSSLLGGKLVAMLAASKQVRDEFHLKYNDRASVITGTTQSGELALLTTSSALGRSSIYNRISLSGRRLFISVGYTRGSGEFHFSNGLYSDIARYANEYCQATAKNVAWGHGYRNRREVIKKSLAKLGFSTKLLYHGIKRELFVVPLATNTREFLRGEVKELAPYNESVEQLSGYWRERWLLHRAARQDGYTNFKPEDYSLWKC